MNLGALERKPDERDFLLGGFQAPVQIPYPFIPDVSWLKRNYQGPTDYCGPHGFSHFQAIVIHALTGAAPHYTPRQLWIKIKQIDGYPLAAGTDMRSIFKAAQAAGIADFEPLENDITLPIETYSSSLVLTQAITSNAEGNVINSYAFGGTDFASICQAIYQNKAVLLLIKCDDGFWGTTTPTFTQPLYGHFICAYGYDQEYLYIVDSADESDANAFKKIAKQYVTSTFFFESGTAVDIPPAQIQQLVKSTAAVVQEVQTSNAPTAQKLAWYSGISQVLQSLLAIFSPKVGSASPQSMNKNWYASKTVWFNALTIVVAVATYFGFTPDQALFSQVSTFLVSFAPVANIGLRFLTKQPIASPITQ